MESSQKPSLSDKLKALGVNKGVTDIPISKRKDIPSIQDVLDGHFVSTRRGEAFIHEETYDADYRHGWAALETDVPLDLMADCCPFSPETRDDPESGCLCSCQSSGRTGRGQTPGTG